MAKWRWVFSILYPLVVILCPPLLGWTNAPWQDASVIEYAGKFTNLIPLRGILDAVSTYGFAGLRPYALHLIIMMPVGLFEGFLEQGRSMLKTCGKYAVVLAAVYALRLLLKQGSFDVDDILLNLVGVSFGWYFGKLLHAVVQKKKT